ncbi:MAG: cytidine deaminase [Opitutaceae bacterium]|jgi:cytidine deaminase
MKPPALTAAVRRRLENAARKAARAAYAPYSRFRVGAAVLAKSGRIFSGCNVENASYGLCMCAERTAIFAAASAGERAVRAVAIYTPTHQPTPPCGACRQVIAEFGPDSLIISVCDSKKRLEALFPELLPESFGPKSPSLRRRGRVRLRG